MQCSMTPAMLSIFGAKTKVALTGVRNRVGEPHKTTYLIFLTTFSETNGFPGNKCFLTKKKKSEKL